EKPKKVAPPIFVFDVVVTHVESPNAEFTKPEKLEIIATFGKIPMDLAPDQVNVSDFKPNTSLTFQKEPNDMRKLVKDCGVSFAVTYAKKIIGAAQASFPLSIVDAIDRDMADIVHTDTVMLERGGESTGKVEFLCRLVCMCAPEEGESECQRLMDRSINPQDIMFVLGESQVCPSACAPCANELEEEEGDE
ncbi:hypothetical protein KR059_000928, partial [Drosophila kikkawai]